nr:hypothetical protein [Tanacetum cinerariifolium]
MANLLKDIQCAGFDTRPPMLDKTDFASWKQHIRLYCLGKENGVNVLKSIDAGSFQMGTVRETLAEGTEGAPHLENGVNILKSIDEGPFQMGTVRELLAEGIEGAPYLGPKRPRVYSDLSPEEKDRRMIPEPGDANRDVNVTKTFHEQTDDELSEKELKQIEADDQAIQTILLGLPKDIYTAVDSCETAQEIWLRVQQMMKGSDIGIQEKKAKNKHFPKKITSNLKFLNNLQPEWGRHVTIVHQTKDLHTTDYTQLYDFLKYNQKENYLQQPMPNPKDITDSTTVMNMALALMAKAFKLNYSTPTNNNQRISSNPRNRQIVQPGMSMGQDRQMQMVGGNGGNQFRQYAV